jgi:hypothetical protein
MKLLSIHITYRVRPCNRVAPWTLLSLRALTKQSPTLLMIEIATLLVVARKDTPRMSLRGAPDEAISNFTND